MYWLVGLAVEQHFCVAPTVSLVLLDNFKKIWRIIYRMVNDQYVAEVRTGSCPMTATYKRQLKTSFSTLDEGTYRFDKLNNDLFHCNGKEVFYSTEGLRKAFRAPEERIVWILSGASGLGKSTLGRYLEDGGKTVYETDSARELPEMITEDVIILGNRSGFTVEDVTKRIPQPAKVVSVPFELLQL